MIAMSLGSAHLGSRPQVHAKNQTVMPSFRRKFLTGRRGAIPGQLIVTPDVWTESRGSARGPDHVSRREPSALRATRTVPMR